MLGPLGGPELLIILAIVILIFGVGRISGIGKELGSSIKEFRRAVKDEDKEKEQATMTASTQEPQQPPSAPANPPGENQSPKVF